MRKNPPPTIEELAIEVHEATAKVTDAQQNAAAAREAARKRLCVAFGRGDYERGRAFLRDLLDNA